MTKSSDSEKQNIRKEYVLDYSKINRITLTSGWVPWDAKEIFFTGEFRVPFKEKPGKDGSRDPVNRSAS